MNKLEKGLFTAGLVSFGVGAGMALFPNLDTSYSLYTTSFGLFCTYISDCKYSERLRLNQIEILENLPNSPPSQTS